MSTAIVFDLGYGDAGKGTIVDFLARDMNAGLVVRSSGGPQNAHNVVTADGIHHTFRQYGSGALAGVPTHVGRQVILEPVSLFEEYKALRTLGANTNITIDLDCLIATDYHSIVNKVKEIERGINPHGSCGWGINETVQYALDNYTDAIRARDYYKLSTLKHKLYFLHAYCSKYIEKSGIEIEIPAVVDVLDDMETSWDLVVNSLGHPHFIPDNVIFEGSQGVLLDQTYGFFPYVTRSNTTTKNAVDMFREWHGRSPDIRIGVTRTYSTRHGAGPLVSEANPGYFPPELHNEKGVWQGSFRKGWLDLVGMRYAMDISPCDVLAVTCMDEVDDPWFVVDRYQKDGNTYPKIPFSNNPSLSARDANTHLISKMKPVLTQTTDIIKTIEQLTDCSVALTSHGPRSDQKEWRIPCLLP
jgi:adenylosuccinate synthase